MVVLRCRCFESSAGLESGGRRGEGGVVRREVHSIVIRGEGSSARGSSRGPSLLRRRERRLSSEFIGVSGRIGPSLRETGVQTSLGSSGRSRGGSVRELSWGGLTEFSTEEWLWAHRSSRPLLFQQTHKRRHQRSPSHSQGEVEVEKLFSKWMRGKHQGKLDPKSQGWMV